ncbi:hypothetical protein [Roseateles sp.]|uniref:hypothetical protein n=1 Tax=Roseateles sp. TaxID=1971397 RepID=UPI0031D8D501
MTLASSSSTARRGTLPLTPHIMLDPPLPPARRDGPAAPGTGLFDADVGTVWKSAHAMPDGGDALLTMRCFSIEGLQLRLAQLLLGQEGLLRPEAVRFLAGGLDQAYVDAVSYRRLAAAAPRVIGDPDKHPLYVDLLAQRLVIDTSRCFVPGQARITGETVHGVVALLESPQFRAVTMHHRCALGPEASEAEVALAARALLDAARRVARQVLQEPDFALSGTAEQLARDVGPKLVARALFTGAVSATSAVAAAFAARWKTGALPLPKD